MKRIDKAIFKNITLLYVEDDEMTLEEISFFLKKYVKKLIIAKDGVEGLALFKEHSPDMIITDIQMPKMDGLEMSAAILKINPYVPIAVTSAYSDGDYLIKAIELGIDKYLLKPINMIEMLAIIQKSLNLGDSSIYNEYKDYIQFILDSNPTFMFILHGDKIEYANKKFLNLLGHETVCSLKEHFTKSENIFEFEDLDIDVNWMDYIINHKEQVHLVSLKKDTNEHYVKSKFYVSYKYFESTNKSVFIFIDVNKQKLNKIESIVQDLLKNSTLDEEVSLKLNEISKMVKGEV